MSATRTKRVVHADGRPVLAPEGRFQWVCSLLGADLTPQPPLRFGEGEKSALPRSGGGLGRGSVYAIHRIRPQI